MNVRCRNWPVASFISEPRQRAHLLSFGGYATAGILRNSPSLAQPMRGVRGEKAFCNWRNLLNRAVMQSLSAGMFCPPTPLDFVSLPHPGGFLEVRLRTGRTPRGIEMHRTRVYNASWQEQYPLYDGHGNIFSALKITRPAKSGGYYSGTRPPQTESTTPGER